MTWISAPAGSGKSILVSSYLEAGKLPGLWYSCKENDNDLSFFFHYLRLFHDQLYPLQKGKLPCLQNKQHSTIERFGNVFFQGLFSSFSPPSILVLDDFHCIEANSLLHIILCGLLDNLPNGLSIVIISRHLPPSAYSRLETTQQLSEILAKELMFTRQETEDLVRLLVPDRTPEKPLLEAWYSKTQGWVTGLILLLQRLQNDQSFYRVGDEVVQEHIFDYFTGEFFDRQKQTTKKFLILANLLTSFSSHQAYELTGNHKARQIIHDMVSYQFMSFQRQGFLTIYQFHPLLHDFLLFHLNETYSDSNILFFKNKAARLLTDSGQLSDAADLYQQTNNDQALSQLLLGFADKVFKQGEFKHLQSLISSLPKKNIAQQPWLAYWFGMAKLQYEPFAAKPYFEMALNQFIQENEARGTYLSWSGIANSYVFALHSFKGASQWMNVLNDIRQRWPDFPDMETRIQLTFSALNLLGHTSIDNEKKSEWALNLENLYSNMPMKNLHISFNSGLIIHNIIAGDIKKIREVASYNYKIVMSEEAPARERIDGCVSIVMSALLTILPENIDGVAVLDKGLKIAEQSDVHLMDSILLIHGIQLFLHTNQIVEAKKYLHKLQQRNEASYFIIQAYYYLLASHIEAEQGNHSTALTYVTDSLQIVKENAVESIHEFFFTTVMALQLNEAGRYEEANKHLEKAEQLSLSLKSQLADFMLGCFKAHAAFLKKEYSETSKILKQTLCLGRRCKIFGFAHWRHSVMASLLQFALRQGIETDYVAKLIRHSKKHHNSQCR